MLSLLGVAWCSAIIYRAGFIKFIIVIGILALVVGFVWLAFWLITSDNK